MKALAAIMLVVTVVCSACTKDPENGGNGGNNGGGINSNHEYVDLGLPSGTLWATCNVGATTPEGSGYYFAWGETTPKSNYEWSSYLFCDGSLMWSGGHDFMGLTKYCNKTEYGYNGFTDNLTSLLPEDDAATANWGDDWRTPSRIEWDELDAYCTATLTTRNGVHGCLFTGPNGDSLFLLAAGYNGGNELLYAGSKGHYWSSSLNTYESYEACGFLFGSEYNNWYQYTVDYDRFLGFPVRPVRSARQN